MGLGMVFIGVAVFTFDRSTPIPSAYLLVPIAGTMLILAFGEQETIVGSLLKSRLVVFLGLTSSLAGGAPLLALDMYEHAYHIDYGANAAAYVEAFMDNIDWAGVYQRYQHAVHAASDALGVERGALPADALVLDVRRAGVYEKAVQTIAGAQWRDPAAVAEWAGGLPAGREVVVYCVYGHEVGRATAMRLRAQGVNAKFIVGGIDGWQAAGLPLAEKAAAD